MISSGPLAEPFPMRTGSRSLVQFRAIVSYAPRNLGVLDGPMRYGRIRPKPDGWAGVGRRARSLLKFQNAGRAATAISKTNTSSYYEKIDNADKVRFTHFRRIAARARLAAAQLGPYRCAKSSDLGRTARRLRHYVGELPTFARNQ